MAENRFDLCATEGALVIIDPLHDYYAEIGRLVSRSSLEGSAYGFFNNSHDLRGPYMTLTEPEQPQLAVSLLVAELHYLYCVVFQPNYLTETSEQIFTHFKEAHVMKAFPK